MIRLLTEQVADCKSQNNKDLMSLFCAVNKVSLCVVRALVEVGLGQLNCGRSVAESV